MSKPQMVGPTTKQRLDRIEAIMRVYDMHEPHCPVVVAGKMAADPAYAGVVIHAEPCNCWLTGPKVIAVDASDEGPAVSLVRHAHPPRHDGADVVIHEHAMGDQPHDHHHINTPDFRKDQS